MCDVCLRECKGWLNSFTCREVYLSLLQFVFLIALIAVLTFVVLHLYACPKREVDIHQIPTISSIEEVTTQSDQYTPINTPTPLPKGIKCTWKPSIKTTVVTHYYEDNLSPQIPTNKSDDIAPRKEWTVKDEHLDGELVNDMTKGFLIALVKYKPPQEVIFGCILTIVAQKWTLTAASCLESIEELDSLDSFVMMEGLGDGSHGRLHAVSDVLIHPLYQGENKSYDLAALKSEDILIEPGNFIVKLPTLLDYMSITIGDKMDLLGFGKFRNIDRDTLARRIRKVSVYKLPMKLCPADNTTWSLRHLVAGEAITHGFCRETPICAGVLHRRSAPCNYCAGAPLVYQSVLLGIMSDNPHCGITCEPVLYVNIAAVRDWIDSII